MVEASMNNLNEPPRWNIHPNPRERGVGAEDGNKWNYALLLPLLGLAAFRELYRKILHRKAPNSVCLNSILLIRLTINGQVHGVKYRIQCILYFFVGF